jgi:hypothetical protein
MRLGGDAAAGELPAYGGSGVTPLVRTLALKFCIGIIRSRAARDLGLAGARPFLFSEIGAPLVQPPVNTRARFNVCPTTTIDTIVGLTESDSSFRCVVRDYFGLMVISTAASGPRWSRSEA